MNAFFDRPLRAPRAARFRAAGLPLLAALALWGPSSLLAQAPASRSQTLQLKAGWNAVFLGVQPANSKPAVLFAGLPVETVACFYPGRLDSQYLRRPGDAPWRGEGWAVWHAPSRPDAFLSNLHEVQAGRGLLILAKSDFSWTVTGEVRPTLLEWHPNTCTFTGLPVDPAKPPTFASFFEGSPAHKSMRLYRLENGNWKVVRDPATEQARDGEAYWIETEGGSTWQGPMQLGLGYSGRLEFTPELGGRSLTFANRSSRTTARVKAELVGGSETLPLVLLQRDARGVTTGSTPWGDALNLPALPPGGETSVRLQPDWAGVPSEQAAALLKITDDRGFQFWVPVQGRRAPLPAASHQP